MTLVNKLMVPVLALGIGSGLAGCGKTTYNEQIGDKNISYSEREIFPKNRMKVIVGDTSYVFEHFSQFRIFSHKNPTSIKWENEIEPDFRRDVLSRVTIEYPGFIGRYNRSDHYDNTIRGRHKKSVFDNMNNWYNQLRGQIRDSLRARYEREHKPLES